MCDNVTAISYVNNMGSIKSQTFNDIACRIWDFCTKNQLLVSAAHIPETINIETDKQFRVLEDATEWKLISSLFHKIVEKFGKPDIDFFATRINKELDRYVSWHPELQTMAISAFSLTWNNNYDYMFPPFSFIGQVLAKIHRDKTNAVIVVPDWSTQYWHPQLLQITNQHPLYFCPSPRNLTLSHKPFVNHFEQLLFLFLIFHDPFIENVLL